MEKRKKNLEYFFLCFKNTYVGHIKYFYSPFVCAIIEASIESRVSAWINLCVPKLCGYLKAHCHVINCYEGFKIDKSYLKVYI